MNVKSLVDILEDQDFSPKFMEEFVSASFLPHTHLERFPSVLKEMPV